MTQQCHQLEHLKEEDLEMDAEIHTIQVFREAISCENIVNDDSSMRIRTIVFSDPTLIITPIQNLHSESPKDRERRLTDDGIGGDWAIEMDEVEIEEQPEPMMATEPPALQRGESSLYSFYFDTPLVPLRGDSDASDDFTITSNDTGSFHDTTDLNLNTLEDTMSFWEQGLAAPYSSQKSDRCISPAHVSLSGDSFGAVDRM